MVQQVECDVNFHDFGATSGDLQRLDVDADEWRQKWEEEAAAAEAEAAAAVKEGAVSVEGPP